GPPKKGGNMEVNKKLNIIIEKLIDFDNINVGFKVEFKDKKSKKKYKLTRNENAYLLEIEIKGNRPFKINLNSSEDLQNQEDLSDEDKRIFSKLFDRLNNNQIDKISIGGLRLKNPILSNSIAQPILANVSSRMPKNEKNKLYVLWRESKKEKFKERLYESVENIIANMLKEKLAEREDLPSSIFPTSIAIDKVPNYYIFVPPEKYTLDTKMELFNKLANSICGRCGQKIYGLYVPEEGSEIKEILKDYIPDFYNVNISSIAGVGRINLREIEPFEYMFYLLDKIFQEMFRGNKTPTYYIELFVIEGVGGGKKFFSHYIIPNLNGVFERLYKGNEKYWEARGISKIKALISSFLVENWNIDKNLKKNKNNLEIAHAHINRLLYSIFYYRKLDMDSILFLEDLKIKLGDTTQIMYLEEVVSWM
ncbi:hypothetical protein J7K70_00960, partial [bacterium]|nr:hypothetical protein [bacterium]